MSASKRLFALSRIEESTPAARKPLFLALGARSMYLWTSSYSGQQRCITFLAGSSAVKTRFHFDLRRIAAGHSAGGHYLEHYIRMNWLILMIAGLFETVWAVGLKYTDGFSRLWPSVFTLAAMAASVWLLSIAMKTLPLGTAYAVWTGIGAVGAVIAGIVFFGDAVTLPRLISVGLIIAGLIGLKMFTPA